MNFFVTVIGNYFLTLFNLTTCSSFGVCHCFVAIYSLNETYISSFKSFQILFFSVFLFLCSTVLVFYFLSFSSVFLCISSTFSFCLSCLSSTFFLYCCLLSYSSGFLCLSSNFSFCFCFRRAFFW